MKKVKNFIRRFLKPFWFSSSCEYIKVPYVYGTILMALFFSCVLMFAYLAWKNYSAGVLGAFAGVIATLAGLYFGTLNIYNKGIQVKADTRTQAPARTAPTEQDADSLVGGQ